MNIDHSIAPPAEYLRLFHRYRMTPAAFARHVMHHHPDFALAVMEHIGSYPSSEPALAALQRIY